MMWILSVFPPTKESIYLNRVYFPTKMCNEE